MHPLLHSRDIPACEKNDARVCVTHLPISPQPPSFPISPYPPITDFPASADFRFLAYSDLRITRIHRTPPHSAISALPPVAALPSSADFRFAASADFRLPPFAKLSSASADFVFLRIRRFFRNRRFPDIRRFPISPPSQKPRIRQFPSSPYSPISAHSSIFIFPTFADL